MTTEPQVRKYDHPEYTDEEIDALINYFNCEGLDLRPILDKVTGNC